jgi:hypothetical protein
MTIYESIIRESLEGQVLKYQFLTGDNNKVKGNLTGMKGIQGITAQTKGRIFLVRMTYGAKS